MTLMIQPTTQSSRRPRRMRNSASIRDLVQETQLTAKDLIWPLFVLEGEGRREAIPSLPGVERLSIDLLLAELERYIPMGLRAIDLFAYVPQERKDECGSEAVRQGNLIDQSVRAIKQAFPSLCVLVDVALDPYTTHGHDGLIDHSGYVINDATVEQLVEMSLLAAGAGCDFVAPSDMMDGRVGAIRTALDRAGFQNVGIVSYTAKYASALYGPFRDALHSAPRIGDKRSYQMDPANRREALVEAALDAEEGADFLMVKPALHYLDVIAELSRQQPLPIAAYHVSGEYAMVMAAHEKGWIDGPAALYEALLSIKRAGADSILSYATPQMLCQFQNKKS